MNDTFEGNVATVGFFDGVHVGHRFLIEELKLIAKTQHLKSLVVTFSGHPRKILNSDFQPQLLTSLSEKKTQLESTGIDNYVVLDFTPEMSQLSAYEFLKTVLKDKFNVRTLLVGHDHRFGHNRAEGFVEYKKYGKELDMEVIQASRYTTAEDEHISSSTIRMALHNGNIEHANKLLTYEYTLSGKVMKGFGNGRKLGFPTANIIPDDANKLIPATGVYAVVVTWNNTCFRGMLNIGNRPTLNNGTHITIEVNILDFEKDIYNEQLEIRFIRHIRDEHKFNSLEELKEQIIKDRETVMKLLH